MRVLGKLSEIVSFLLKLVVLLLQDQNQLLAFLQHDFGLIYFCHFGGQFFLFQVDLVIKLPHLIVIVLGLLLLCFLQGLLFLHAFLEGLDLQLILSHKLSLFRSNLRDVAFADLRNYQSFLYFLREEVQNVVNPR